MFISDTAIRRPVLVTMMILLAVVLGALAYRSLPVNLLPDISLPVVSVTVTYPGSGPETVAEQVTEPLEDELATLNGINAVTSTSTEGVAVIVLEFVQDRDPDLAVQDVRETVSLVRAELPDGVEDPVVQRFDPAQQPILTLAARGMGDRSGAELRNLLENEIVPAIERVPNVGSISISGGRERQVNVQLLLSRLTTFRILPAQVTQAINTANVDRGLGDTLLAGAEVNLRVPSAINEPANIAAIGIPGTEYQVGDVAVVNVGLQEVDTLTRLNGDNTLTLAIRKQSGTNTVDVADAALAAAEASFARFPELSYTVVRNDAEQVRDNVEGALEEVFFAVLFASLVVGVFFRDLRNTLVTVMGLPLIIIATFAAFSLFDLTINIITLLALSISVGLVIDDAIVVRENIFRHMEMGESPQEAASQGTAEVAGSVLAMTLTLVAVFVPVAFTSGTAGIIFGSFGIVVAAATVISLFEAFTLAPMVSAYWFKGRQQQPEAAEDVPPKQRREKPETQEEPDRLGRGYRRVLVMALRRRWLTISLGLLAVAAAGLVATQLDFAFLPDSDRPQIGVAFELPAGTPLEATDARAREVEATLLNDPAVETLLTTVGTQEAALATIGGGSNPARAEFLLQLQDDANITETVERLREQLTDLPNLVFALPNYQTGTSTNVTSRPIQVQLRGTGDLTELAAIARRMMAAIEDVPGLQDLGMTYDPGNPQLNINLRLDQAREYGLSNADLADSIRVLVDGRQAAIYREEGRELPIIVQLRAADRQEFADLRNLRLAVGRELVPLAGIATIEQATGATTVRRANQQAEIVLGANNIGRNVNDVQAEVQARLAAFELPPGVTLSYGGSTEEQAESFQSLLMAMALSILFVYMVLAGQFGSYFQPLLIMLALPMSAVGAFLALTITDTTLTLVAMIGFIMLIGLVVKNSILLVDFINQRRREGRELSPAIVQGSVLRLRPILMTSLSVILGSLPAAIGFGAGTTLRSGLAIVVIGGMITSTLLTLFIVPVAYSLLESAKARVARWRHGKEPGKQGSREAGKQGSREAGKQGTREAGNQGTRKPGNQGTRELRKRRIGGLASRGSVSEQGRRGVGLNGGRFLSDGWLCGQ